MDLMDVLTLINGLALFLFGMNVMGDALKKSAGHRLKTVLGNWTSSPLKGFALGLGTTAVIQSSSATTVMVVGFVSSGAMLLSQAVGVIIGANVGTAVTAWLTALNGLEGAGDALDWLKWLKPSAWVPVLALIGMALVMFGKKSRQKDIGTILMGFAVLMTGMDLMGESVRELKDSPSFTSIIMLFRNPFLGVLMGTVLTVVVQSSSASIGILQALSVTGAIPYGVALPIILGQNIGTCVTALLSSISANKDGKRAAMIHLYFNVFGVIIWLGLYYLIGWILRISGAFDLFTWADTRIINMWGIALVHTVFKVLTTVLFLPFTGLLEKLANATIRGSDRKGDEYTHLLDDRLLLSPVVAMERSHNVAKRMTEVSSASMREAMGLLKNYDGKTAETVRKQEETVDLYEDALGSYLVKLSSKDMEERDSHEGTKLLRLIGDLERISDHSVNLVESAEELRDKDLHFSEEAQGELDVLTDAVSAIITLTEEAFVEDNLEKARRVEPLEQVVDDLKQEIRMQHTNRLQSGMCTMELGFILSDILTDLERVADHCSNIAGCLVEMSQHESMNLHGYLHDIKENHQEEFEKMYREYRETYRLPAEKDSQTEQ